MQFEVLDGVLEADSVGVLLPGCSSSSPGREAPVGRSISGRGHFGSREDTVGIVQCFVRQLLK